VASPRFWRRFSRVLFKSALFSESLIVDGDGAGSELGHFSTAMMTNIHSSALANWDGRLSGPTAMQVQPAQGSNTLPSASTTTTPTLLNSTHTSAAASTITPSVPINEGRSVHEDDLADVTLVSFHNSASFSSIRPWLQR
jgi:hypothetical protein